MNRLFFSTGALMAGLAVAAGAYGAHGGSTLDAEQMRWIAKAARYQMYHGLALMLVSLAAAHWPENAKMFQKAGWLFLAGILFFSGSLYIMACTGMPLGYVTPVGGFAFLAGWGIMAFAGVSKKNNG